MIANSSRIIHWESGYMVGETSNYFIEKFGGKNMTTEEKIPKFVQGMDPHIHIEIFQQ